MTLDDLNLYYHLHTDSIFFLQIIQVYLNDLTQNTLHLDSTLT